VSSRATSGTARCLNISAGLSDCSFDVFLRCSACSSAHFTHKTFKVFTPLAFLTQGNGHTRFFFQTKGLKRPKNAFFEDCLKSLFDRSSSLLISHGRDYNGDPTVGSIAMEGRRVRNTVRSAVLIGGILLFTICGEAQQPGKIFRIGFLDSSTASGIAVLVDAFRQELHKLGWIEGKNITIEYRFAEQKPERLPELAADLVRLKVDLIVVSGGPVPLAAKKATATIPIVMTIAVDPVGAGLVASLARPGGNITGLSALSPELNSKRLEVLKDAVPKLARVGLLRTSSASLQLKEIRPAAVALKLKLEEIETQPDAKGLESALQTAKQKQVGAIMTITSRQFFAERKRIVELAGKYRLPAIYFQKEFVDEGGLMSYGADFDDLYRRAAVYVDKVLKGTKPADLPVQQATKFEFIINLKAAKQIGLTIPPDVLARANKVVK
jgi:putative tryptophan/tyrosine transport system substrate-binding protein